MRMAEMLVLVFVLVPSATLLGAAPASAQTEITLETLDGRTLSAHLYPGGTHAVVMAHGGVFDKESWSEQAAALVEAGLTVLAFDFRGYGNGEPQYGQAGKVNDVLAAIDYLDTTGHERISIVGGSMGALFSMQAAASTDRIDLLVLLAPGGVEGSADIQARSTLFIVAERDRLRDEVDQAYQQAPEPKCLEVLPGAAHAQHIFATEHGEAVTRLIVDFLTTE